MARKVTVEIGIDDNPVTPFSSLSLTQTIDWHHHFQIACQIQEKDDDLLDRCNKYIGKVVKIDVSSDWFKSKENIFMGIVTRVGLSRNQGSNSEIIISGYSPTILMDDGPNVSSFSEKKLKEIASQILGKYGDIETEVNPKAKGQIDYIVQYKESNYQFLQRIAALFGEWCYYDGVKYFFGKPKTGEPKFLKLGKELLNFDLSLKLSPTEFKLQAYDYLNNKVLESPSSGANVPGLDEYGKIVLNKSKKLFSQTPLMPFPFSVANKTELDGFALAKKSTHANELVTFNGRSDNPFLKIGSVIKIQGGINIGGLAIGSKEVSYGEFIITEISHFTDGLGNYENQFEAIPSTVQYPPTNNHVKTPFCDSQIAVVKENSDPEKLGRIRVQFQWQGGSEMTPWIRLASTAGGNGQGFFIIPEVDDEVLVGFNNNNPSKPHVLGCMYHGKAKPGDLTDPKNNKKGIKTKSGNEFFLSDEGGKEEIKIVNGGNIMIFTLDGPKITITTEGDLDISAKKISITAETDISISAGGNMSLEAGSEMTINAGTKMALAAGTKLSGSGMEVAIEGQTKVTASAGSQMDISGGATASISAPMLKLN